MTKELTEKELEQKRNANKSHGLYAFRDRGIESLGEDQRSVYITLRDQFKSEPGRLEYREHLASHLAMMIELGFTNLGKLAERGYPIWDAAPVKRMGTYINSLLRLLDNWPKQAEAKGNIYDVLKANESKQDQDKDKEND